MTLSRRKFLTVGGSAVVFLAGGARVSAAEDGMSARDALLKPWIAITRANRVAVLVDKCEMGQGVRDLFARIVARELHVAPETILLGDAPVGHEYRNHKFPLPVLQITGYSSSTADVHGKLVSAARETAKTLRWDAARQLGVFPWRLSLKDGWVLVTDKPERRLSYAEVVGSTGDPKLPARVPCDPMSTPAPLGPSQRVDARDKVTGCARFGIDVDETELGEKPLVAVMIHPDRADDELELAEEANAELSRLFAARVVRLPSPKAVAIVASSFWHASRAQQHARTRVRQAPRAIDPVWADSDKTLAAYVTAARADGPFEEDGRSTASDQVYETPYAPHAPLEPMTASCVRRAGVYHVWTATQFPPGARALVVAALKRDGARDLRTESVVVHGMLAGGSFGRRNNSDFIVEAARICHALDGRAVKLIWTRDDDFRQDYLRPCTVNRVTARVKDGRITEWTQRIAARSANFAMVSDFTAVVPGSLRPSAGRVIARADDLDPTYAEGIVGILGAPAIAYDFRPSRRRLPLPGPEEGWHPRIGYWRSVNFFHTIFAAESTIDDLAARARLNPVEFRLRMLGNSPRLAWCLEKVAPSSERARYATILGDPSRRPDRGHGVACFTGFESFAALAVEVRIDSPVAGRPEIRVVRAVAAVDCGPLQSEDVVRQQVEGGVVFGLSSALKQRITLVGGVIQERNFDQCDLLRMHECPEIVVQSRRDSPGPTPTGVGELMVPLVAPAVANAVFSLTGQRLLRLPLALPESRA
jgi:CO/xanthine dehydrogenase Mo-binding subunit